MRNIFDNAKISEDKNEINRIIDLIKRNKLKDYYDVPKELRLQHDVVRAERIRRIRYSIRKGFDVTRQLFFVDEYVN